MEAISPWGLEESFYSIEVRRLSLRVVNYIKASDAFMKNGIIDFRQSTSQPPLG
jgi:hypothetical protein